MLCLSKNDPIVLLLTCWRSFHYLMQSKLFLESYAIPERFYLHQAAEPPDVHAMAEPWHEM